MKKQLKVIRWFKSKYSSVHPVQGLKKCKKCAHNAPILDKRICCIDCGIK
jgi:hypothetical protein